MLKTIIKVFITTCSIMAFWALLTPIFEFPDEQAHVGTVNYLVKEGRVPVGEEADMTQEMKSTQEYLGVFRNEHGQNQITYHPEFRLDSSGREVGIHEEAIKSLNNEKARSTYVGIEAARYPRLYYDYMSVFYRLSDDSDIMIRTFAMRLGNVVLAGLTGVIVYMIGQLLFSSTRHALVLTMLTLLQPMYSFVSAGINSDNLHNLLFTTIIYFGLLIIKWGLTPWVSCLSVLVVYLGILTKPQGYLSIAILISAYLLHIVAVQNWRRLWGLLTALIFGAVAIYHPMNPYKGWIMVENVRGASVMDYLRFSLNKLVAQNIVWYWGVFKWLGVVLPPIYWQVANRLVIISGLGLLVYCWKKIKHKPLPTPSINTIFLLLVSGVYTTAIYYFDYQHVKSVGYSIGVQARYLFPTIVSHMGLLMIGLLSFSWRKQVASWILRGLVVFIAWMQLGGLWRLITSYYDTGSLSMFITQVSQYKPDFAKGEWWYLWGGLYLISLSYLIFTTLRPKDHIPGM